MNPNHEAPERPVRRLLTPLLSKKVPEIPTQEERKQLPMLSVNVFSRIFFIWLMPLLSVGYKRTLTQSDLWILDESLTVDAAYEKFKNALDSIVNNHKDKESSKFPKAALIKALIIPMKWNYFLALLLKSISSATYAFIPWVMKYLIQFVEKRMVDPSIPINAGIGYSLGITALLVLYGITVNQGLFLSRYIGAQSRTILTKALLEKSLKATPRIKYKFPNGKIISMMGTDLQRIDDTIAFFPNLITAPIPISIGIIILIVNIKASALAGIAVFLILLILIGLPVSPLFSLREKTNKLTDKRVGLTREILMSMKMIKFYSWEDAYENIIKEYRSKEIQLVYLFQLIMACLITIAIASPLVTSTVAFLVLYAISGQNDAATIFSSLSLFNVLSNQIIDLPVSFSFCIQGYAGLNRVTEFLESFNEINENEKLISYSNENSIKPEEKIAIKVIDASFEWEIFEEFQDNSTSTIISNEKVSSKNNANSFFKNSLDDETPKSLELFKGLNLTIEKGEFIVITGTIGSGKSSLLAALFGLMNKSKGSILINGSIILCDSPWVQNETVRENVTFGHDYEPIFYKKVIEACSLNIDLIQFDDGDLTEIGERGVTLSGGQKSRINLARAIYSNKDIYLMDDILSAVDANVGKHITENCLLGLLSNKTRIVATHQLSLINKADRIIFLNNDKKFDIGTESELKSRNKEFANLMNFNIDDKDKNKKSSNQNSSNLDINDNLNEQQQTPNQSLYDDEERAFNSIPLSLYLKYIKTGQGIFGPFAFIISMISVFIAVFLLIFTNVWLSYWIGNKFEQLSVGIYMGIYILLTFVCCLSLLIEFGLMSYFTTISSKILNLKAIHKILHTPMSFMDTTPIGRILNRFSKDTNTLDNEVGERFKIFIHILIYMIGILILAVVYIPWFAIALPILFIIFLIVINFYQASSREVTRLEAINRSFILNNFNEVLGGLSTIKAYNAEFRFLAKNSKFSDMMNEVYFVVNANQRWIAVSLDTIASFIVLLITLLSVTRQFNISATSAGLLVTYIIEFAELVSVVLRNYSELENEMNSVERVCHYAFDLEQEAAYNISETTPSPKWPENGFISFKDISLRYREGLPLILKNLSFEVEASSKIGICGRTGAGKSSLMTAIYRIVELSSGSIEIDGIDISKLGLHQLRSKISIIPQDPVLFQGTLRRNLDPFNEHTDDELWDSLRRSGLLTNDILNEVKRQTDNFHKFHLLSQVEDEGNNFSLGEKQLIALARALVRNCKILILDEATSSVDYETDSKIQATLAKEFKDCTVLCIAHRLRTIIKYDKILVLEKGMLEEFGKPLELFKAGGVFSKMCEVSSILEESF